VTLGRVGLQACHRAGGALRTPGRPGGLPYSFLRNLTAILSTVSPQEEKKLLAEIAAPDIRRTAWSAATTSLILRIEGRGEAIVEMDKRG
jgi:hypothetical protein